jgi:GNAT superfamily N-acetyltransferase
MKIVHGFPEHMRQSAAEIYYEGFRHNIGWILGGKERAIAYLAKTIDPDFAICAINDESCTEKLVGVAGFKTAQGSLVGGGFSGLAGSFGFFSALWRAIILSLLERKIESGVLLMDGIAVTSDQRGKGTGTKLLSAIIDYAKSCDLKGVRLDVIDANPRARKLYERVGFKAVGTEKTGILKPVFGFSSATQMLLRV